MTNMIGFALGLGRHGLAEYANAQKLASSFEKAHKLVHALAINDLMTRSRSSNDSKPAVISGRSNAIVVVRPLSIAVESLLGIVITLITGLILQSCRRRSQLQRDPASLTDIIRMMPKDSVYNTLADCQKPGAPRCTTSLIEGRICVSKTEAVNAQRSTAELGKGSVRAPQDGADRVYPFETTLRVGIAFMTLLGISIAVTVALKVVIDKNHGLPLPSRNTTVNQLILNYVPIVFATFLEPFWLLLNRVLCVLKPFQALSKADATSSRSLDLKYTSLPPQLTIVRALRARHYMLVAVCAIGLSANLLAVSLNGLMESSVREIELAETLSPQFSPIFRRIDHSIQSSDYQYIAKTNFSDGLSLPPWTAPDRFFVPFVLKAESGLGEVRSNRATTQGFGLQANCQRSTFNDTAFITGENNFFYTRERTPAGRLVNCGGFSQPFGGQNRSSAALEVFLQLRPVSINEPDNGFNLFPQSSFLINATQDELLTCNSILVAGFLRGNLTVSFNNTKTQNSDISQTPDILAINSLSSLWMTCRPRLVTAPYDVTVDLSGRVETYEAAGPDEVDLQPFFADGVTPASLVGAVTTVLAFGQDRQPYWHNDTLVDTWFAYFVKHRSNSTIFVDPAAPVPQFESVAPHVEDVYARLSAIVLSRNQPWLAPGDEKLAISGFLVVSCQRVLMSQVMFLITVVLLALNMVVAVAYWAGRPSRILPRMPYSIASIMDMLQGSGLVSDVENVERWKTEWKFGYGRYVDTGGKPRLGIERRPFIIPLAS
ncbi:MAG: hypothetical protein Q9193_002579 [Seirophora villosa]